MIIQAARFDRDAKWTLALVLLLLISSLALMVYRFTLPYDGWLKGEPEDSNLVGYIFIQNVVGLPSGLQTGDQLIAVDGITLEKKIPNASLFRLSRQWQAGNSMRYTILRQGREMDLLVPLAHPWQERQIIIGASTTNTHFIGLLGIVSFLAMGFIAFFKRPENQAARGMLWLGTVLISVQLISSPTQIQDEISPAASIPFIILFSAAFTVFIPPAFIRFGLVFPRPKPILSRLPWIAYLPYGVGSIGMLAFLNGFYIYGWIWMATSIVGTIFLLIHNAFTMRDAVSRAQLGWGLGGMLLGMIIFLSSSVPVFFSLSQPVEEFFNGLGALGLPVMGASLSIAILRYRLYDIDLIIRRTLQYGVLSLLLGLVYYGMVILLGQVIQSTTGQQAPLVIVVSTLAIAALFNPLRRRVQAWIDRRFYRQQYDAVQAVESFAVAARSHVELEALASRLVETARESLQPEEVWVWIRNEARPDLRDNRGDL